MYRFYRKINANGATHTEFFTEEQRGAPTLNYTARPQRSQRQNSVERCVACEADGRDLTRREFILDTEDPQREIFTEGSEGNEAGSPPKILITQQGHHGPKTNSRRLGLVPF